MFWIGLWSQTGDKKTYLLSESLDIWLTTRRADILSIDTRAWAELDGVRCWEITINHTFREQCTLFDKCYMIRDRNMRLSWCELIICPNCPLPSLTAATRHGRDNLMGLGWTLNWTHLSRKLDPTSESGSPRLIHLAKWVTGVWSVSGVNSSYSNSQNRLQTYYWAGS